MIRVKKLSKDEKLRIIEEKREKGRWIYESQMAYARDKGLEQGREEGIEKGRATEREEAAVKLIKEGLENSIIARVTGWTEQEVINFKKKM